MGTAYAFIDCLDECLPKARGRTTFLPNLLGGICMTFVFFSLAIAATFFISSLILLNYGRSIGLRYVKKDAGNMAGLATVGGAVFALIGLLLAFTISGALQRFDERRQLVIQEANAARTAHERLGLFEPPIPRDLQANFRTLVQARIALYRTPHALSPWQRAELSSPQQQHNILDPQARNWDTAVAACPEASFRPACGQALPAISTLNDVPGL